VKAAKNTKRSTGGARINGGPKKKIPGLRVLPGGKNPRPLKDAPSDLSVFDPPLYLNVEGRRIWASAVRSLTLIDELSEDFLPGLLQLSALWQRMVKKIAADQDIDYREHETFRKLQIEFGLTPAARHRIDTEGRARHRRPKKGELDRPQEPGGDEPENNEFAAIRERASQLISSSGQTDTSSEPDNTKEAS
jgi:hypothetical protein